VDRAAAEEWIRAHVTPTGPIQTVHERPWATVLRVPLASEAVWFKACGSLQTFEPNLTARLFIRWPAVVPQVLGCDRDRAWLLLSDSGIKIAALGNPPDLWLALLPRYAELQQGEAVHAGEHLEDGVPDLRVATLPGRYEALLSRDLPLENAEIAGLHQLARRFEQLCAELDAATVPETVQHDDLHMNNVYFRNGIIRVIDWGDSCISHPFASLVPTFRFLQERNGLPVGHSWFRRLRDAYLEPWGSGLAETFALATRVGAFAHAMAPLAQREALTGAGRAAFDVDLAVRLRWALTLLNTRVPA
jgi:hypothetical protein